MAILEKEVEVTLSNRMVKYYLDKGYIIPKNKDKRGRMSVKIGTKILVKVDDLPLNSAVFVTKICDICGKHLPKQRYENVVRGRNAVIDYCRKCSYLKIKEIKENNIDPFESIVYTHPHIARQLKDKERGYKLTSGSNQLVDFICENCGTPLLNKSINNVTNYGLSCPKCSDSISFPEKLMLSLLDQLKIEYEYQKSFSWSNNKKYDFYIPFLNCIVETHGEQHYKKKTNSSKWGSLNKIQMNDKLKKKSAIKNGVDKNKYIIIDCRKSNLEFIKDNIINSELNNILNLSIVNWSTCLQYTATSLLKKTCDIWNSGIQSTLEISKILKINRTTVTKYLRKGTLIGLCEYNPIEIVKASSFNNGKNNGKRVIQLNSNNVIINEFPSTCEAYRITNISYGNISAVCRGERKTAGKYKWMYKEDYDEYIKQAQ